jgi:hypothetical protein
MNVIIELSNILSMTFAKRKNKANNNIHMTHEEPFNNIESSATPTKATHVKATPPKEDNINNDM